MWYVHWLSVGGQVFCRSSLTGRVPAGVMVNDVRPEETHSRLPESGPSKKKRQKKMKF